MQHLCLCSVGAITASKVSSAKTNSIKGAPLICRHSFFSHQDPILAKGAFSSATFFLHCQSRQKVWALLVTRVRIINVDTLGDIFPSTLGAFLRNKKSATNWNFSSLPHLSKWRFDRHWIRNRSLELSKTVKPFFIRKSLKVKAKIHGSSRLAI